MFSNGDILISVVVGFVYFRMMHLFVLLFLPFYPLLLFVGLLLLVVNESLIKACAIRDLFRNVVDFGIDYR